MFGSTVLEVAIGMSFCYAFVALLVTTLQEALASALRLRARTLVKGIQEMLNDPQFTGLARALYSHALVNPRDDGLGGDPHAMHNKPSYIDPRHFTMALLDCIGSTPGNFAQLGRDIDALPDPQLRAALQAMYLRAGGELEAFHACLERWFDNAMERVSGQYKRMAVARSLLLSLLIAVLFNIDSVHLFQVLWYHPQLAGAISAAAPALDGAGLAQFRGLPVGWEGAVSVDATRAAGWALTASSSLFGAPFWFELLQRLVNMRGTGDRPPGHSRGSGNH
ncbi:MAG: hypothetical protein ACXU8N_15145 [Telluria sp.]